MISYREYPPHAALAGLIECYWIKRTVHAEEKTYRILPDGCTDFIFNFTVHDLPLFLAGMDTVYKDLTVQGSCEYFGIRFRAGGLHPFIGQPVSLFKDARVEVRDISRRLEELLMLHLGTQQTDKERLSAADTLFLKLLATTDLKQNANIRFAVARLLKTGGATPVTELARQACLSERQLQRRFTEVVGLSPKSLGDIIRFTYAHKRLSAGGTLSSVAHEAGYFDHSHLIKSFRKLSGKGAF